MPQLKTKPVSPFSRSTLRLRRAQLTKKPRLGSASCFTERVRRSRDTNSRNASGMQTCLYDTGRRSRITTYQRDGESNLDYAMNRYESNVYGRFQSTDKGPLHLQMPTSLNR